jgi:TRAP-type C4-dicarboxylate transport system permease small subunit
VIHPEERPGSHAGALDYWSGYTCNDGGMPMSLPGRIFLTTLDVLEIHIPTLSFALMFVVFIIEIAWRYLFVPLTWTMEFSLMAFLWTTLLGACWALRDDSHVVFGLVYDSVGPKAQRVIRIAGNGLLCTAFCIALYPSWKFVAFMGFKRADVMQISMSIVFFPYVVFTVLTIGRLGHRLWTDLRSLASPKGSRP